MTARTYIILGLLIVQAIFVATMIALSASHVRGAGEEELAHEADTGVALVANLVRDDLRARRVEALASLASRIVESGDPLTVRIFDVKGRELAYAETPNGRIERLLQRTQPVRDGALVIGEVVIGVPGGWLDDVVSGAIADLAYLALPLLLLSAALYCGLGLYLDHKLHLLKTAAESIAGGNFGAQLPERGLSTFVPVIRAVNGMSAYIAKLHDELERALSYRTHALRSTFAHMSEGVAIFDKDGGLIEANDAFATMLGFEPSAIVSGTSLEELVSAFEARGGHSDDPRGAELAALCRQTRWPGAALAFEIPTPDGRVLAVQRTRLPDGGFIAIHQDVTQQRDDERRLLHAAKLATLGELATATAHELNQPLNVIRLSADNAKARVVAGSATADYLTTKLERIAEQTTRAAAIIDHMRIFGRKPTEKPAPFDLSAALRSAVEFFAETSRLRGYRLDLEIEPGLTVVGHPALLEQVVANIVSNAIAALGTRPGLQHPNVRVRAQRHAGRAHVEIADNAGGVPSPIIDHIFEPFFTTKPGGEGTGLGLSISYGIVKDMGGALQVRNAHDGAVFSFDFALVAHGPHRRSGSDETGYSLQPAPGIQ